MFSLSNNSQLQQKQLLVKYVHILYDNFFLYTHKNMQYRVIYTGKEYVNYAI